jgi:hypothetical protein
MYDSDPRLAHDRRRERQDALIEEQKSMHELMDSLECNTTKELKRLCKVYGIRVPTKGLKSKRRWMIRSIARILYNKR